MSIKLFGVQFIIYSVAGALTCLIDLGLFVLFSRWLGFPLIESFVLAFSLATLANYFFCLKFVFAANSFGTSQRILRIFFVSLVGLALGTLFFGLLDRYTEISPIWNKILIIPIVMIWNFWSRRSLVFSSGLPDNTANAVNKLFRIR